jgi:hypothetical protein|tara:strand:- start:1903 stop:2187 length:285 start_codon:yes stop_codon:yes gene_type:complete
MAKKKGGKSSGFISQGQRPNVKHNILKAVRRDTTESEKMVNIMNAYLQGRNPWLTVPNTNTNETNKKFVRIKAEDLWGSPKNRGFRMTAGATNE